MKVKDLAVTHSECELKDGFMDFIVISKKGKVYSVDGIEEGQTIYIVNTYGDIAIINYYGFEYEKVAIKQGNVFYDKQSAKEEIKRREVCHKAEKYSYRFSKEEWENQGIVKSFPYYDYNFKKISIGNCTFFRHKNLYFKSKEDIEKAIEEVGKENFIKYFLGVEL